MIKICEDSFGRYILVSFCRSLQVLALCSYAGFELFWRAAPQWGPGHEQLEQMATFKSQDCSSLQVLNDENDLCLAAWLPLGCNSSDWGLSARVFFLSSSCRSEDQLWQPIRVHVDTSALGNQITSSSQRSYIQQEVLPLILTILFVGVARCGKRFGRHSV